MSVDKQTVAKIASLARIKMSDEELERMAPELNNILEWVEQLGEVDTSNVAPMTAVIPNVLRLRDDVVDADPLTGGGKRDDILANAPAAEHGCRGNRSNHQRSHWQHAPHVRNIPQSAPGRAYAS